MENLLKHFVGIDISKKTFDVSVLKPVSGKEGKIAHKQFTQKAEGFSEMEQWLKAQDIFLNNQTLFCMEHTGIYNQPIVSWLTAKKALVWVEMAIRIKKASGFSRGNDDKTDSAMIATYAFRFRDKMQIWNQTDENLVQVKNLMAQRDRVINAISALTVPVEELLSMGCKSEAKQLENLQKGAISKLEESKNKIEATILILIKKDTNLFDKVKKVVSIKGIGMVTAVSFLVYTNGFSSFKTAKELACYCGVVPFVSKESGTSVKAKARVSHFANKKLKCLLHLCSLIAIRCDEEIKGYYERKVKEGKNKMCVINAVRNKLVARIFAVVRDNREFVDNYVNKVGLS